MFCLIICSIYGFFSSFLQENRNALNEFLFQFFYPAL